MADNSFGIKKLNLVGSGTPKIESPTNLNLSAVNVAISTNATVGAGLNVTGVVTASSFSGDGSGLTGITGSGSGVVIKDSDSTVGTAGTINFGSNLSVSAVSAGVVTVTASGGGGIAGINTTGTSFFNEIVAGSAVTASSLTIDDYIYHQGDTNTFIGFESNDTIRFNTNGSDKLKINSSGHLILADDNNTYIHHPASDSLAVTTGGSERLRVNSSGITVIGTVAATALTGDGSGLTGITGSGSGIVIKDSDSTIGTAGTINFGSNLSVSAVSAGVVTVTASGGGSIAGINTTGTSFFNQLNVSGVSTFGNTLKINSNGSHSYITEEGSGGLYLRGSQIFIGDVSSSKTSILSNPDTYTTLYYNNSEKIKTENTGAIIVGVVSATEGAVISGVSTFTTLDINGDVDIDGHAELDELNVAGVVTATTFSGRLDNIVSGRWGVVAVGTSAFGFTGYGLTVSESDPTIFCARGQTYEFEMNQGGLHPFQIQTAGGAAYNNGVIYPSGTSATSGIVTFTVAFNAPNSLRYRCLSHAAMEGTIAIYPLV